MQIITQLAPDQFRFEYEYPGEAPKLKKGKKFKHQGRMYRIVHYYQVFGEQIYCSFLVIAKPID